MPFVSASQITEQSPHPAFDRVSHFVVVYELDQEIPGWSRLKVQVKQVDRIIGRGEFTSDPTYAHSQNVAVDAEFRRRGIATSMYVLAEKIFGKALTPLWNGNENSEDAKALWKQPKRPFGNH
jgi:ribosomal protein S18 acetylase RimI-like enzyme